MSLSTLLSPLFPLLQFFGLMFEVTGADEPDTSGQPPSPEHTDPSPDEPAPEGDEPPPEEPEEPNAEDEVRRNAARKISNQGRDMRADDLALISLLAEAPSKAPRIIAMLQDSNPKQAERLARLFQNNDNDLAERLKNADPVVRETLQSLAGQVQQLSTQTDAQVKAQERRIYLQWQKDRAPYLNSKTPEGQTGLGKRLHGAFMDALDTLFPEDTPLTEEMLEDALVVAKRRSGWQDSKVKAAVDRQAAEQAARARAASSAHGGTGVSQGSSPSADPAVAAMFGHKSPEQLKKIAEAKKRGGFR